MGKHVAGGGRKMASARQHDATTAAFISGRGIGNLAPTLVELRERAGKTSTGAKGTFIRNLTTDSGTVKLFGLNAPAGTHRFRVVSTNGKFPTLDEIVRNDEGLGGRQVSFPSPNEKIVEVFID